MRIQIGILDVVASAFVVLLEHDAPRKIYYANIDNYASIVVDKLNSSNGIRAVYSVSKESQKELIEKHAVFFEEFRENNILGIRLKDNVSNIQLWRKFCSSFPVKVLMKFRDTEAISTLLI